MIRVSHDGPVWALSSQFYSKPLYRLAKSIPGISWDPTAKAWVGRADAIHTAVKAGRAAGLHIVGDVVIPPSTLTAPLADKGLRDYQRVGVEFLIAHGQEGVILADDLGLGKTAQAIVAARAIKGRTVVVCPAFVRYVWAKELEKWWPAARVAHLKGTKPTPIDDTVDVAIINYDVLHAWADLLGGPLAKWSPAVIVFDELHYCMSPRARRTRAGADLSQIVRYRIGLTGTPMTSRPRDLWSVAEVLTPGRFGNFFDYGRRYCDGKREQVTPEKAVWNFDGASRLDELHDRMTYSPKTPWGFMLRRLKSDVAMELPPLTRQMIEVAVAKPHRAPLASAFSDNTALRRALDTAADGKIADAVSLVKGHLAQGHKVVVLTYRRAIAETIGTSVTLSLDGDTRLARATITGDVPQEVRKVIVDAQPNLLCATMDSTSVGIDLSFADVVVFVELDWVPSKLLQCEGRLHRFGQARPVLAQYLIARGTADDYIRRAVLAKLDNFHAAIGKTDDKLVKDLRGLERSGADTLRALYERLKKEETETV